jgi:hypothetical protein
MTAPVVTWLDDLTFLTKFVFPHTLVDNADSIETSIFKG